MIKEAIILAGGLGTRLRSVVSDIPKCMAPVNGKPFLHYLITFLQKNGIEKIILSVGYLYEPIEQFLKTHYEDFDYKLSIESTPLGTGGGIKLACKLASEKNVLICNGDTLFDINVAELSEFHNLHQAECTLSLKPMQDSNRYGVVEIDKDGAITAFKEKGIHQSGLINGGVYALYVPGFLTMDLPEIFSFEKDYLEKNIGNSTGNSILSGIVQDKYFIDIGIPEDYQKAQEELKNY